MKKESQDKENAVVHYFKSMKYSMEGLVSALREERSFRLFLICTILVTGLSIFLKISKTDAILVSVMLVLILSAELANTAIESVVDLVTEKHHPLAKRAKDCASAATFVLVVLGIILGVVLFLPYMK